MKHLIVLRVALLLTVLVLLGRDDALAQSDDAPFPPHRVVGNIYYVGSRDLASFLITTGKGHILINSCYDDTVPLVRASVEQLGFKVQDIKILLTSHAHPDHAGGHALMKRLTGAQVLVMEGDDDLIRSGGKGDFAYDVSWEPCQVDKVLHDGDVVKLDNVTLVARLTPGHTKGCTTWALKAREDCKVYDVVIVGSPNVNPGYKLIGNAKYPAISEDFKRTFQVLKSLPCDVFLGAHGSYYGLEEKYARLKKNGSTNPFIDREGYRRFVEFKEKQFLDELAKQRKVKP